MVVDLQAIRNSGDSVKQIVGKSGFVLGKIVVFSKQSFEYSFQNATNDGFQICDGL